MKIQNTERKMIKVRSVQAASVYRVANGYKFLSKDKSNEEDKDEYVDSFIDYKTAVINESIFSEYARMHGVTVNKKDCSLDFILMKFEYGVDKDSSDEKNIKPAMDADSLRKYFYENDATITWKTIDKKTEKEIVGMRKTITYRMLYRNPGKAKKGECIFIRKKLYNHMIKYLTMGLYKRIPNMKGAKIVELSAYAPLITATAIDYIHIPLDNMLVVKDESVACKKPACVVNAVSKKRQVKDFKAFEPTLNQYGFTTYKRTQEKNPDLTYIKRSKQIFEDYGIDISRCPMKEVDYTDGKKHNKCVVEKKKEWEISNILWDGMGLIDSSIFPADMNGFIYCRSHFFKSCLFKGNLQQYFQDYYKDEYENAYIDDGIDLFGRKMKISDIKVIVTDNSLKWLKFTEYMSKSGSVENGFRYYKSFMERDGEIFQIVKTAHASKYGDLQRSSFQMNNTLLTLDREKLKSIAKTSIDYCNALKQDDEAFLNYLRITGSAYYSINNVLIDLYNWNDQFRYTQYFKKKRREIISKLKRERLQLGKLFQNGDNLTICGNPIALLKKVTGQDFINEGCFETYDDRIQCYTRRFAEGDRIAGFRNPHNSPNNIVYLENVYPKELVKYFPDLGREIIVINGIGTDVQDRLNSQDLDSDTLYATNQPDIAELARKAYVEYPTIINNIPRAAKSDYYKEMESYAKMDNQIAKAQADTGVSSNIAQLALSYWFDGGCNDTELEDIFIICSVLAQCSIDSAKRNFDVTVAGELTRLQGLACMNPDPRYPRFYAELQKLKDKHKKGKKKNIDDNDVRFYDCPMDILYQIIGEEIVDMRTRGCQKVKTVRDVELLADLSEDKIRNKRQSKVIIDAVEKYKNAVSKLDKNDEAYSNNKGMAFDACMEELSGRKINMATMQYLVRYAINNESIRDSLLVVLHDKDMELFLEMFKKSPES